MKSVPFLLMLGAFGKSAQFPLYVWLPDAMEGPTPVSALIHAATMVTAGVYMIARCGTLFVGPTPPAMTHRRRHRRVHGAARRHHRPAAVRSEESLRLQHDQPAWLHVRRRRRASRRWPAVFHLVTHAFFKALLFLCSGVVMHAMLGELDMRKMSGLKKVLPKTSWLMLIGCLALAGFPLFSGFFSKDEIVAGRHSAASSGLVLLMLFTGFLTAYYTFRLYFRVFQGPLVRSRRHQRTTTTRTTPMVTAHDDHAHDHEHHNHEPRS